MSVSVDGPGRSRRKRLDGELNLVPYIDLLTCMIAFLLITAVWTQLARLRVGPGESGALDGPAADVPRTKIVVVVGPDGFNLVVNEDRQVLPKDAQGHDFAALAAALAKLKASYPDKEDALVASDDAIQFETIVGTMDTLLSAGFPQVSLTDTRAAPL